MFTYMGKFQTKLTTDLYVCLIKLGEGYEKVIGKEVSFKQHYKIN